MGLLKGTQCCAAKRQIAARARNDLPRQRLITGL